MGIKKDNAREVTHTNIRLNDSGLRKMMELRDHCANDGKRRHESFDRFGEIELFGLVWGLNDSRTYFVPLRLAAALSLPQQAKCLEIVRDILLDSSAAKYCGETGEWCRSQYIVIENHNMKEGRMRKQFVVFTPGYTHFGIEWFDTSTLNNEHRLLEKMYDYVWEANETRRCVAAEKDPFKGCGLINVVYSDIRVDSDSEKDLFNMAKAGYSCPLFMWSYDRCGYDKNGNELRSYYPTCVHSTHHMSVKWLEVFAKTLEAMKAYKRKRSYSVVLAIESQDKKKKKYMECYFSSCGASWRWSPIKTRMTPCIELPDGKTMDI